MAVESQAFRKFARENCYEYRNLLIHTDSPVCLDPHSFPNFHSSDSGSSLEEFIGLTKALKTAVTGAGGEQQKLPRLLPTIKWDGDQLDLSISINGVMYFTNKSQYDKLKSTLSTVIKDNGWTTTSSEFGGGETIAKITAMTYKPKRENLYSDDPIDAAGRAMIIRSAQHAYLQMNVTAAYLGSGNDQDRAIALASAQAQIDAQNAFSDKPIGGFGFMGNIKAGIMALGANMSGGIASQWASAGSGINLKVNGVTVQSSIPMIMKEASFTERDLVVDKDGQLYPTAMDVSLTLMNAYGAILTAK